MGIPISKLPTALKNIAKALDNQGNQNDVIDANETPVFKAASAFMVLQHYKITDSEYKSIFMKSAFQEWNQKSSYQTTSNSSPIYEYSDKNGNIIRGSVSKDGIDVYTENKSGQKGYYSNEIVMPLEE